MFPEDTSSCITALGCVINCSHPPSQGGERQIVGSPPCKAASRLGEPPVLMLNKGCIIEHKFPCWMRRFIHKEQLRLVQEGCQERLEEVRVGAGCGKPAKFGMTGVSGSGTEDVGGVLKEDCDVEGSDAAHRITLSPEIFAKPLAWADEARLIEDACAAASAVCCAVHDVELVAWSNFCHDMQKTKKYSCGKTIETRATVVEADTVSCSVDNESTMMMH